jgi:hypothetical protein
LIGIDFKKNTVSLFAAVYEVDLNYFLFLKPMKKIVRVKKSGYSKGWHLILAEVKLYYLFNLISLF